jgi:hypothetical protein
MTETRVKESPDFDMNVSRSAMNQTLEAIYVKKP